jgi:hypothetical protein
VFGGTGEQAIAIYASGEEVAITAAIESADCTNS